ALDNGSAASIEKLFTSKGGYAIDYDRQVLGGSATDYVTFDGKAVGEAQARGVIAAMKANGTYKGGTVAELWGGPTDQNAFWFKSGNDAVFNPLFKKGGTIKKGPHKFVPDWDANNAATIFNQMLVQTNNNIQGVLAANDNIAGAVVADLKAKGLKPLPLSGQDATPQGLQYILAGWQTGTVFKYVPLETNAAAAAAIALIHGKKPKTNTYRMNGKKHEVTQTLPVEWITKHNYTTLFKEGFLKKSDVCIGTYKQYCK
ncbi:MAG: substrate-binding domain-containing protein, partial [Gaiellaceae bacterium]